MSRAEQLAFWLNAYDAFVLQTVIDRYPIQGRAPAYPPNSIRQIPGAFERMPHRVGGRTLTLDQIEQTVLPEFSDPRVFFAISRGAVGGGRLRSEAFAAETIEEQLTAVALECSNRIQCAQVDRDTNKLAVSPIFSWREKDFVAAYAGQAPRTFSTRADRALDSRLHRTDAADRGARSDRAEHLSGRLRAVRLVAQRLDRPRRALTLSDRPPVLAH